MTPHQSRYGLTSGFTVVELVVVILLVATLSVVILPKLTNTAAFEQKQLVERLLNYARFSQQLAMNNTLATVQLILQQQCSIAQSGQTPPCFYIRMQADYDQNGSQDVLQLPDNLDAPYYIDSLDQFPSVTLSYDRLGNLTANAAVSLSFGIGVATQLCVEPTGFMHQGSCY